MNENKFELYNLSYVDTNDTIMEALDKIDMRPHIMIPFIIDEKEFFVPLRSQKLVSIENISRKKKSGQIFIVNYPSNKNAALDFSKAIYRKDGRIVEEVTQNRKINPVQADYLNKNYDKIRNKFKKYLDDVVKNKDDSRHQYSTIKHNYLDLFD